MARNEESSSATNPCGHHTLAVLAAALATCGRASVADAARATAPRTTERLLSLFMLFLHAVPSPAYCREPSDCRCHKSVDRVDASVMNDGSAGRARTRRC